MRKELLVCAIAALIQCLGCNLIFDQPIGGLNEIQTVPLFFNSQLQEFRGKTLQGNLVNGSMSENAGNIILAKRVSATVDANLYYWQARLPKAVILVTQGSADIGSDEYLLDCWNCANDFLVPFVSISIADFELLTEVMANTSTFSLSVELTFSGENAFQNVKASALWTAGQVLVAAMSAALVALSLWKIIEFSKAAPWKFTIAQVSLLILVVAGTINLINWAFDPWFSRKLFPYAFWASFISAPYPMIDLVAMMMSLYWFELITLQAIRVSPFLAKMVVPYFVLSLVLLSLEYITAVIRSTNGATFLVIAIQTCLTLVIIGTLVGFYTFTSAKVLQKLKSKKNEEDNKLRKASITFAFAIFGLIVKFGATVAGVTDLTFPPLLFYPTQWLISFANMEIGICLAVSFQSRHKKYTEYSKTRTISASQSSN